MKGETHKPIFDFSPLRNFLRENGYIVEKAQGFREIKPEEVTVDAISNGEIEFTDSGIFVKSSDGEKHQVFLYKRNYFLIKYGKPKYHICRCSTIKSFIQNGIFKEQYVRANTETVPVYDMDTFKEKQVGNLPLCSNCRAIISNYGNVDSNEFVNLLRKARESKVQLKEEEVDIFGYTKDWETISRKYREKNDYTCEECGLKIENAFNRQYIHVHHLDKNKLNNSEKNLRCLCMRCHSKVDSYHKRNLTTGANRFIWSAFNKDYPEIE